MYLGRGFSLLFKNISQFLRHFAVHSAPRCHVVGTAQIRHCVPPRGRGQIAFESGVGGGGWGLLFVADIPPQGQASFYDVAEIKDGHRGVAWDNLGTVCVFAQGGRMGPGPVRQRPLQVRPQEYEAWPGQGGV